MTPDVIGQLLIAAVGLIVTLIGGGVGWSEVKKHGAETEKRKQAEANLDALAKQHAARAAPYLAPAVRADRLRRAAARLRALRDRAAGR